MRLSQDLAVKVLSAAVGAALAISLAHLLSPKIALRLPQAPHAVKVTVRTAGGTAAKVAPAPAPTSNKELRLQVDKPVPVKKAPKPRPQPQPFTSRRHREPAPPQQESPPAPPVSAPDNALLTLSQPALGTPVKNAAANLPRIGQDVPGAPPEAPSEASAPEAVAATAASDALPSTFTEQPGGPVLVLGLLLNDQGRVLDTRILVPSFNPLTDMAVSMASIGKTWANVQPPLNPGESRWVELRIPFQDPDKPQSNLP